MPRDLNGFGRTFFWPQPSSREGQRQDQAQRAIMRRDIIGRLRRRARRRCWRPALRVADDLRRRRLRRQGRRLLRQVGQQGGLAGARSPGWRPGRGLRTPSGASSEMARRAKSALASLILPCAMREMASASRAKRRRRGGPSRSGRQPLFRFGQGGGVEQGVGGLEPGGVGDDRVLARGVGRLVEQRHARRACRPCSSRARLPASGLAA